MHVIKVPVGNIDGFAQNSGNFSVLAFELLQSYAKPSRWI